MTDDLTNCNCSKQNEDVFANERLQAWPAFEAGGNRYEFCIYTAVIR